MNLNSKMKSGWRGRSVGRRAVGWLHRHWRHFNRLANWFSLLIGPRNYIRPSILVYPDAADSSLRSEKAMFWTAAPIGICLLELEYPIRSVLILPVKVNVIEHVLIRLQCWNKFGLMEFHLGWGGGGLNELCVVKDVSRVAAAGAPSRRVTKQTSNTGLL